MRKFKVGDIVKRNYIQYDINLVVYKNLNRNRVRVVSSHDEFRKRNSHIKHENELYLISRCEEIDK